MNTLGRLERMLLAGDITEEEYKEKKTVYVETILEDRNIIYDTKVY